MKRLITFAGPPGCGKTPIATYLSWKFGIGIFSTDAIRSEVIETHRFLPDSDENNNVFNNLRDSRLSEAVQSSRDIIIDASVDRRWTKYKSSVEEAGYNFFIISFDLPKEFVLELLRLTAYRVEEHLDAWLLDHQRFVEQYKGDISLRITPENYKNRIALSHEAVERWLQDEAN